MINRLGGQINLILGIFGVGLKRTMPRHSTLLAKKYFQNKKIHVVEVGVFKGKNAKNILKNLNVEKIYLIDPYLKYENYKKDSLESYNALDKAKKEAKKRLSKYSKKITWINKFSDDAIKDIPNNIDFIYIDGNHNYKYVKKDIENYFPIIKKGGILAGHDIADSGIVKAFCEFITENKLDPIIKGEDWLIIKK